MLNRRRPPGADPTQTVGLVGLVVAVLAIGAAAIVGCVVAWVAFYEVRMLARDQVEIPGYLELCPGTVCVSGDFFTLVGGCLSCEAGFANGTLDTITSAGTGESLVYDGTGLAKSLVSLAGTGAASVTNPNGTDLVVHVSPVTLASVGAGTTLVADGAGPDLALASLAGAGISSVATDGTTVTVTTPNPTLGSAGGLTLVQNAATRTLYGLQAGTNMAVTLAGSAYVLDASAPGVAGAGGIFPNGSAPMVVNGTVKQVSPGSSIAVSDDGNNILVSGDVYVTGLTFPVLRSNMMTASDPFGYTRRSVRTNGQKEGTISFRFFFSPDVIVSDDVGSVVFTNPFLAEWPVGDYPVMPANVQCSDSSGEFPTGILSGFSAILQADGQVLVQVALFAGIIDDGWFCTGEVSFYIP